VKLAGGSLGDAFEAVRSRTPMDKVRRAQIGLWLKVDGNKRIAQGRPKKEGKNGARYSNPGVPQEKTSNGYLR